jgi:leucyl/phenylalanyl-tRNA--protein transferase
VARLRLGGFRLLDTQFVTSHLLQFGTQEVPRDQYKALLADAVDRKARWDAGGSDLEAEIKAMAR